jgi:hypothetical protein
VSHKFKIGQLVNYLGRDGAPGVYQVTQLLPQAEDEVFGGRTCAQKKGWF